jgi:hypothetical protein
MAYLTDVLERIVSGRTKAHELAILLPWNWKPDNASLLNAEPGGILRKLDLGPDVESAAFVSITISASTPVCLWREKSTPTKSTASNTFDANRADRPVSHAVNSNMTCRDRNAYPRGSPATGAISGEVA